MAVGVNDQGIVVFGGPDFRKIVEVNMSVDQIAGLKYLHEPEK
jgi:hypothetical protein